MIRDAIRILLKYVFRIADCTGLCKAKVGGGLRQVCGKIGVPPVLSYGTCTDTGRVADLLGMVSHALGDVPIPDLPVAVAAPEYMEQKATVDAVFALALGFYTYVNPVPTVTGGPNLVKLLTQDCRDVTGGLLNVETDAVKAAEASWRTSRTGAGTWVYGGAFRRGPIIDRRKRLQSEARCLQTLKKTRQKRVDVHAAHAYSDNRNNNFRLSCINEPNF